MKTYLKISLPINPILRKAVRNGRLIRENRCYAFLSTCIGSILIDEMNYATFTLYGTQFFLQILFLTKIDGQKVKLNPIFNKSKKKISLKAVMKKSLRILLVMRFLLLPPNLMILTEYQRQKREKAKNLTVMILSQK